MYLVLIFKFFNLGVYFMDDSKRVTGKVRWFSSDKGFGFAVTDNDPDTEYFIHFSVINMEGYKTLKAKQPITFVISDTEKGVQAIDVKLV